MSISDHKKALMISINPGQNIASMFKVRGGMTLMDTHGNSDHSLYQVNLVSGLLEKSCFSG
jgi:hypothetical protein